MVIGYVLKVSSEYHIGTGMEHPGFADRTLVMRKDGTMVVPSEHFRGVLRDACTQALHLTGNASKCCEASLTKGPRQMDTKVLCTCGLTRDDICVMCRLFGTTFTPRHYEFMDSIAKKDATRVSMHNRVDPATGRVPEDTFFSLEVGKEADFNGCIQRDCPQVKQDLLQEEVGLLLAGLRLMERVGSRSRRGWGECRVEVDGLEPHDKEILPKSVMKAASISAKVDAWLRLYLDLDKTQEGGQEQCGYA